MIRIDPVDEVLIRPFTPSDVVKAHALSSSFGWPQRIEDWQWFGAFGKGFVAEQAGAIIGTALHWDYERNVSSIGAVMVDPNLQGLGIGARLTKACLDALSARSIILHATKAGRPLYEKLGFVARGALYQHQGCVEMDGSLFAPLRGTIVPLSEDLGGAVIRLAEEGSGLKRDDFTGSLLAMSEGVALLENGIATGFSLYRRYCDGWAIGPVVARDELAAQSLIRHWLPRSIGQHVRVDVRGISESFRVWLETIGLKAISSPTPMVRGTWPRSAATATQFAVATQATG